VQRPRVEALVRADLRALAWISPLLVGRIPVAALANPPALVELFAETIVEELDFRLEAENMLDIARVLAETDQRATIVPSVLNISTVASAPAPASPPLMRMRPSRSNAADAPARFVEVSPPKRRGGEQVEDVPVDGGTGGFHDVQGEGVAVTLVGVPDPQARVEASGVYGECGLGFEQRVEQRVLDDLALSRASADARVSPASSDSISGSSSARLASRSSLVAKRGSPSSCSSPRTRRKALQRPGEGTPAVKKPSSNAFTSASQFCCSRATPCR